MVDRFLGFLCFGSIYYQFFGQKKSISNPDPSHDYKLPNKKNIFVVVVSLLAQRNGLATGFDHVKKSSTNKEKQFKAIYYSTLP